MTTLPFLSGRPEEIRERLLKRLENETESLVLACCNWPEAFPDRPSARAVLAYEAEAFWVAFRVEEPYTLARFTQDGSPVWQDSCVEFFVAPTEDGRYYNVECNALGCLLMACGPGRENRLPAPEEAYRRISRWGSLGDSPFSEQALLRPWTMTLRIPFAAFFQHDLHPRKGDVMKANLYKCGDGLATRHYATWQAIPTPRPDFHRPEYFGEIRLG